MVEATERTSLIVARYGLFAALITGLLTLVGVLVSSGVLFPRHEGTAKVTGTGVADPPVVNAPQVYVSARTIDGSLDECVQQAGHALATAQLTGIRSERPLQWGYHEDAIGLIWCHTDARQVIFIGAGPNDANAVKTRTLLERSY
jgi:hypothetical protein